MIIKPKTDCTGTRKSEKNETPIPPTTKNGSLFPYPDLIFLSLKNPAKGCIRLAVKPVIREINPKRPFFPRFIPKIVTGEAFKISNTL